MRVQKLVSPARTISIPITAEYQTVTKRAKIAEGRIEWQPILCQTNATPETVTAIQRALLQAGYDPGPIDGIIGSQTMTAVKDYQRAKELPVGNLTIETLQSLGVRS
jgi:peptidoglycan hydrolase-like protein with peptidoglycan-binding domain